MSTLKPIIDTVKTSISNEYNSIEGKRNEIIEEIYAILVREKLMRYQVINVLEVIQKRVDECSVVN